jgi:hypothetical protein
MTTSHLVAAGEDVLLVEARGVETRPAEVGSIIAEHIGRPFGLQLTRCIEPGARVSSGMASAPLDEIDFEPRPWIEGAGWRFRHTALTAC